MDTCYLLFSALRFGTRKDYGKAMFLEQLYYFDRVAQTQHITRAAEALGVSQPALSRALKNLENELDLKLLQKDGRGVALTEDGKVFARYISSALNDIHAGIAFAKEQSGTLAGTLTFGSIETARAHFATQVLDEFTRRYPLVQVTDQSGITTTLIKQLHARQLDVAVAGPAENEQLERNFLFSQQLVLYAPTCHRLSHYMHVTMQDLENVEVATYTPNCRIGSLVSNYFANNHIDERQFFKGITRTFSDELMLAHQTIERKCVGIGLLTSSLLAYPDLIIVPFRDEATLDFHDVFAYTRKDETQSVALRVFMSHMLSFADGFESWVKTEHARSVGEILLRNQQRIHL